MGSKKSAPQKIGEGDTDLILNLDIPLNQVVMDHPDLPDSIEEHGEEHPVIAPNEVEAPPEAFQNPFFESPPNDPVSETPFNLEPDPTFNPAQQTDHPLVNEFLSEAFPSPDPLPNINPPEPHQAPPQAKKPSPKVSVPVKKLPEGLASIMSLMGPTLDRTSWRENQQKLGVSAQYPTNLFVEWGSSQSELREQFNGYATQWLSQVNALKLQATSGHVDIHHDIEYGIAYTLWRILKSQDVHAFIDIPSPHSQINSKNSGENEASALSFEVMTRLLYGAKLPDIPLFRTDLPSGLEPKPTTSEAIELRIALPPYYNAGNEELNTRIAERLVRLKCVESLCTFISHFQYNIDQQPGARHLVARAQIWH